MRKLKTILQYRYTFKVLLIFIIILECLFLWLNIPKSKYGINDNKIKGIVIDYNIDGNKLNMVVSGREKVVVNYYFTELEEKEYFSSNLLLGDEVLVSGILGEPSNNTVPNTFNYKEYLKNKSIFFIMNGQRIEIVEKNKNIFYELKNIIFKRINKIDKTGYLKIFLLGDKSGIDDEMVSIYQSNGISHLFAISGMHISLFVSILLLVLDKISYNRYFKYSVCFLFMMFYMFLVGDSASILRALVMFLCTLINKVFNLKIKNLDLAFLSLGVILLYNPYIIFDVGFQISYVISLFLIIFYERMKKIKNKLLKSLYTSFLCFLVSFPICVYHFGCVNFISILLNLFFIPFVSSVIFPLCLLSFIFPFLGTVLSVLIYIMESINEFVYNIEIFRVVFVKPNLVIIIIYYIVIMVILYKFKYIYLYVLMIILHKNIIYFNPYMEFMMIDVGQGDSNLIRLPYNKGNVLIDTGGVINYKTDKWKERDSEYSIVLNKTIPYLKSVGIDKLDYLIITHGDYDHMGEAINLVNNFKVEKVIFNCGEFNELEQDLIKVLEKKKIPYYSCIKELNIDDNKLYFLNNGDYGNENDNSSVIYTKLSNYKFLFMGDAGVEVEEDLIEKYHLQDIDVLKVGHHGSRTSSSKSFIDEINPNYSIISVGTNNRYGHPNKEVLNVLEDTKIYRTDEDGSIMLKIKNNKLIIETYSS